VLRVVGKGDIGKSGVSVEGEDLPRTTAQGWHITTAKAEKGYS
jgi:hypothetical protein